MRLRMTVIDGEHRLVYSTPGGGDSIHLSAKASGFLLRGERTLLMVDEMTRVQSGMSSRMSEEGPAATEPSPIVTPARI